MINVEAGRLREPAAWLMVAVASTDVLVGTERLLFGDSFHGEASFAFRASSHVGDLTSPVVPALLVAAVLLAGRAGPAVARLRLMVQLAAGTLGLATLFGTVGVFGGLFAGETGLREKLEFLVVNLPALALTGLALLYLLPMAASSGSSARNRGFAGPAERSFQERSREQYASTQSPQAGGSVPSQGGPVPQQGFFAREQAPQQGFPGRDAVQGGLPQQSPQDFHPREQAPQQGRQQAPQQAPQQGLQQEQAPRQGGFPPPEQAPQGDPLSTQQQVQPAPQPSSGPPALPPAPGRSDGGSDGYGRQPGDYAPAPGVPAGAHPQAAYAQHGEDRSYGAPAYGHVPAAPAHPIPADPAETYTSGTSGTSGTAGSYAPADARPPGAAAPYEPAATYGPPGYASPRPEPAPPASAYGEPSPGYAPAGDHQGYAQQDQPTAFYGTQPEGAEARVAAPYASSDGRPSPSSDGSLSPSFDSFASFPQQPPADGQGAEVPASPYGTADGGPRPSFDGQARQPFPQPPDDYGRPFNSYTGTEYTGAEYGRRTEPNLHYPAPAPDPMNPHSQQIAQAYQQAESYQQSQAGEPRPGAAAGPQGGGSYDDPLGLSPVPQAQSYAQGGHQWDPAPAEATLGFDPGAWRGDALGGPAPAMTWDSQPPIDPTAIYKPERSAQVTGEETPDRERVGPGQEQNMSWYGSDRREH